MKILNRLSNLLDKFGEEEDSDEYFRALTDTLCYAIKNDNDRIAYTIYEHFYTKFSNYRREHSDNPKEYPEIYYNSVLRTVEELATNQNKRFNFLSRASIGGIWLLGEIGEYPIKEKTYDWLWRMLNTTLEYERDDFVMEFWRYASQFANTNLGEIYPEYDYSDQSLEPINKKEIENREKERERFLEFAQALGGLALYNGRYDLLKSMFTYSNSMPPRYELLPDSMDEVSSIYFKFRDPHDLNFRIISQRYYFPDARGISGEGIVKHWICKYSALLFLRQYTLKQYFSGKRPLELPEIPESQSEKRLWMRNLDHFKQLINEVQRDTELMETLNFDYIDDQWCKEHDHLPPSEFIDKLKTMLALAFESEEISQPLSSDKVTQFYDETNRIISEAISEFERIKNPSEINENFNKWFVRDIKTIIEKSPFVENQATSHLNFDTFLADSQARNLKEAVSETFRFNRTRSFLLKNKDLFEAVDKIIGEQKEAIIINFGIYLPYLINQLKIEDLSEDKYKETQIIKIPYFSRNTGRSLYLLKKSDLPSFVPTEPSKEIKEKFELKLINDENKIYGSVIDLNKKDELRNELERSEDELRKSVYLYIASRLQIRWKKEVKVYEIKQYTEFQEKGIPNNLEDINVKLE